MTGEQVRQFQLTRHEVHATLRTHLRQNCIQALIEALKRPPGPPSGIWNQTLEFEILPNTVTEQEEPFVCRGTTICATLHHSGLFAIKRVRQCLKETRAHVTSDEKIQISAQQRCTTQRKTTLEQLWDQPLSVPENPSQCSDLNPVTYNL